MLRRAGCRSPRFALLCCCLLAAMGCSGVGAKRKGRRVSNAAARKVRSAAPPLGKKEEAAARAAFRLMDIDGSGMISEAEMKAATKATSKPPFNYGTWTVMDADADGEGEAGVIPKLYKEYSRRMYKEWLKEKRIHRIPHYLARVESPKPTSHGSTAQRRGHEPASPAPGSPDGGHQ